MFSVKSVKPLEPKRGVPTGEKLRTTKSVFRRGGFWNENKGVVTSDENEISRCH